MTTSRVNPNSLDLADVAMPRLDEDGDKPLSADLAAEHDMLSDTLINQMDSAIGTQRAVRKPIPVLQTPFLQESELIDNKVSTLKNYRRVSENSGDKE